MSTTGRKRLTKAERRAEILGAALDVFAEKGFAGARTQEIADRASVSGALIFQHFGSKEQLYAASLDHLFSAHPLHEEFAAVRASGSEEEALVAFATHVLRHLRADRRLARLSLRLALDQAEGEVGPRSASEASPVQALPMLLTEFIEEGVSEGAFRKVDPQIVSTVFVGAVFMLALEAATGLAVGPETTSEGEIAETLVRVFLDGVRKS